MINFFKRSISIHFNKEKSIFVKDVMNQSGYYWHKVFDSESIQLSGLKQIGFPKISFEKYIPDKFPEMGILALKNAYVFGENGWIINENGYWLPEFSWYGENFNEVKIEHQTNNYKKLKGSCLSLCSDWANTNYSHFLLDTLGRFELYRKAGFSINDIDYVYCPIPSPFAERLLIKLGIPINKCILPEAGKAYQFEKLFVPSFPGYRRVYPQWLIEFLRSEFTEKSVKKFRRLYIPRNTSRKISNEKELISILEKLDFEVFEPIQHMNTPSYFSEAEIVIGAHGAALANLAFCHPGTKVLELIPSDHVFPHWYTLSAAADLIYSCIIGKSENERPIPKFGPSPYDFFIDMDKFENALSALLL
ncbi:MAG: glycosyltransferase family 61 protein [Bacteroidetes bacterium]|nr:glycosyltransferase family 61 protein [Bacteroidota bacterium]